VGPQQSYHTALTVSGRSESLAKSHVTVNLKPVTDQGRPRIIGELRTPQKKLPTDVRPRQPYRTDQAMPGRPKLLGKKQVTIDSKPVTEKGRTGFVG
jgi:hypothetical protein